MKSITVPWNPPLLARHPLTLLLLTSLLATRVKTEKFTISKKQGSYFGNRILFILVHIYLDFLKTSYASNYFWDSEYFWDIFIRYFLNFFYGPPLLNNLDEEQKTKNRPTPAQPPNLNTNIFSARVKLFMIYIYNTGRAQHSSAGKRSAGEAQRATGGRKQATKPGRCPLLTVAACAVVSYHDLNGARRKANSIASASERGGRERRMQI